MTRFSNFLKNYIINFRMFLYLETCFLRVTVSSLCRLQTVSKIHVTIYPYLIIVKGDEIVRPCDGHSNETVSLKKHVTKINIKHAKMEGRIFQKNTNRVIKIIQVKGKKSSMAKSLSEENLLPQNVGSIINYLQ